MRLRTITKCFKVISLTLIPAFSGAQSPVFGPEIPVTINGYTLDAMEPALSDDGNVLFFNSLNDGVTTSIYYAGRVDDSTFNLIGPVPVINQTATPHLDGVPSIDSVGNFYWVSTRQYPTIPYNLHRIRFLPTGYTNLGRVYGDFYHVGPGWLIMDASITPEGGRLLYCNAYFDSCAGNLPCESTIGIAQKLNDSTFQKANDSGQLFAEVNDTAHYVVYAPCLSINGLELYYSRLNKINPATEVLVATRNDTSAPFKFDKVIDDDTLSEAPVLSTDGNKLYYHKKTGGRFGLTLRYRQQTMGLTGESDKPAFALYPNPTDGRISNSTGEPLTLYNVLGEKLESGRDGWLDLSRLAAGVYLVSDQTGRDFRKVIKQ